jgi:hypothetical protein
MVSGKKSEWGFRGLAALRIGLILVIPWAWITGCVGGDEQNRAKELSADLELVESASSALTWSPAGVSITLSPGSDATQRVTFTSSEKRDLTNLVVDVTPDLRNFVSVTPSAITRLRPGDSFALDVDIGVPEGTAPGGYDGTIRIRSGNRTIATPLPISLTVVDGLTEEFGEEGGTIEVLDPNSPIYGARIEMPAGAIPAGESVKITLRYSDELPAPPPPEALVVSKVFELVKNVPYDFKVPASVTVPLDGYAIQLDEIPLIFYWNTVYEKYIPVILTNVDRSSGTVTFQTFHFTRFVALSSPGAQFTATLFDADTKFRPGEDGFFHPNFGTNQRPRGNCLGMAHYSEWYFSRKKSEDGAGLFSKYREGVVDDWRDDVTARELIAQSGARANQSYSWWSMTTNLSLSSGDAALALWTALNITKEPQTLLLTEWIFSDNPGSHAVTVYRWNSAERQFEIYDNNCPGVQATLKWNPLTGLLHSYSGCKPPFDITHYAFHPSGTYLDTSEFEPLYQGAEQGWASSDFARIEILEPRLDPNLNVEVDGFAEVMIRGVVTEGHERLDWVHIFVNSIETAIVPISRNTLGFEFALGQLPEGISEVVVYARNQTPVNYSFYDGFSRFTITVREPAIEVQVAALDGSGCTDYGACGVVAEYGGNVDVSSLLLQIDWGDGSTTELRTIAACVSAGDCMDLGDGRIRIWKLYAGPGRYAATVSHAVASGPSYSQGVVFDVNETKPLGLTATAGDARVDLSWANLDADGYNICRATQPVAEFDSCSVYAGGTLILDVGAPPRWFGGLTNGTTYHFRLEALFGKDRLVSDGAFATPQGGVVPPTGGVLNDTGITVCGNRFGRDPLSVRGGGGTRTGRAFREGCARTGRTTPQDRGRWSGFRFH